MYRARQILFWSKSETARRFSRGCLAEGPLCERPASTSCRNGYASASEPWIRTAGSLPTWTRFWRSYRGGSVRQPDKLSPVGERLPLGRAGLCNIVLNELRCQVFLIGFGRVLFDFDGKFRWQHARNYSSRAQSDSSEMESALVPIKSVL